MCFNSAPPPPPPLPDPEPTAPKAESTAEAVVTGQQRTQVRKKGQQKLGRTAAREAGRKGTASLRIPLLSKKETTRSGNLNTPI
tara:strand:- start:15211 stop:15462 length:252 start_codon:yes stop_codon:yes gene_type:complete